MKKPKRCGPKKISQKTHRINAETSTEIKIPRKIKRISRHHI